MMTTQLGCQDFLKAQDYWSSAVESRISHIREFCSSRDKSAAGAVQMVDIELAAMSSAIKRLRDRRNAMVPISTLTHDSLCLIFSYLADKEPVTKSRRSAAKLRWIKITHVCRRWREVALHHARLWSDNIVSTLGSRWLEEMVARAGSAPISLTYNALSTKNRELLSNHIHGVRHLKLLRPVSDLQQWSSATPVVFSAAMLHSLEVAISPKSHRRDLYHFPIPGDLFADAPLLRHLVLNGYKIPKLTPLCINLTHLEVYGNNITGQHVPGPHTGVAYSHETLQEALRSMTALKSLTLVNCLPPPSPMMSESSNFGQLAMPHLVELTLTGGLKQCASIMQSLHVPALTQIHLHFTYDILGTNRAYILSCMHAHAQAISSLEPLRTLWVSRAYHGFKTFRVWRHDESDSTSPFAEENASPAINVTLREGFWLYASTETLILPEFIRVLAVSELYAFRITTWFPDISSQTWRDTLKDAVQLRSICIYGPAAPSLCEAIATPVNSASEVFLPKLQVLELREVHFGFGVLDSDESLGDLLPQWIAQRHSQIALSRLVITQCHIEDECVDLLKELVELDWDGYHGEYDESWNGLSDESDSESDWTEEDPELAQLVHDVLEGHSVSDDSDDELFVQL